MEADQGVQQLSAEMTDDSSPQWIDCPSDTPEIAGSDLAKDSSTASHTLEDSAGQTSTSYSPFTLAPQIHGNQIPLLETSESQVHRTNDVSATCHAQLYRPIPGADGRLSPFAGPGAAIKYGNISVLPAQTGEAQEGIDSVLSSSGSAPLATPAFGVVPSSFAIPQPPVPLFRQPVGVHLPHYAPSFIPYNQYISPFYFPPHHFMGNAAAFPQPPSTRSMYAPVSPAGAPVAKYLASTYKLDDITGSQTHAGIPGAYAIYGSSPSVYTNNVMVANGTSVETDDVIGSQFTENNVYVAGQQSDGSTVWIPAPGQNVSGLQSTSYGLPPQGQHLAFSPAQAGHGAFSGMYHPAQTMAGAAVHPLLQSSQIAGAAEMVGPPATGYQQPHRAQMNWGSH